MEPVLAFLRRFSVDNDLTRLAMAGGVVVLGAIALRLVRTVAEHRLRNLAERTTNRIDDVLLDLLSRTRLFFLVGLATLLALSLVHLPTKVDRFARSTALLLVFLQIGMWGSRVVQHAIEVRFSRSDSQDPAARTGAGVLTFGALVVVWAIVLLLVLDNLGINITALVAGLGVGGVAVALATQNILGDLFASVSILLDKPFVVGDFIVVGPEFMGTVERIGIKTTRLRSLGGEELVFSNNDLLQSRVRNFKRMQERRVLFKLGVVYQTSPSALERIPGLVREVIEGVQGTRFDRCHFSSFGDFSLVFETVYFVLSPDYNQFMDIHQGLLLAINRRFAAEGVEFAYPTQTLMVQMPAAAARA